MAPPKSLLAVDVLRQPQKGPIVPGIYLIHGAEDYLAGQMYRRLVGDGVAADADAWNVGRFHASDTRAEAIVEHANTPPVGGVKSRLVAVQGVDAWREADQKTFAGYLERPCPWTVMVLTARKLDRRQNWVKALEQRCQVFTCDPLREREIPAFLITMAKEAGKRLSADAAQALQLRCGDDLMTLASEINKLALFVGEVASIDAAAIEAAASGGGSADIFALCDAVGNGDTESALRLVAAELQGTDRSGPIRVTAMLARHYRLLLRAKTARGALPQALGLPPFVANRYGDQARRYSEGSLRKAHGKIYAADRDLKGGSRVPPGHVVDRLILELTRL